MPKKLMDCVAKLKEQGHSESSAYAICVASTGLSPHHEKSQIYSGIRGASNIDVNTNILAKLDVDAQELKNYVKSYIPNGFKKFDIINVPLCLETKDCSLELYKKNEDELYSGVLRDLDGLQLQEFNNSTLDIICSIICAKESKMLIPIKPQIEIIPEDVEIPKMEKIEESLSKDFEELNEMISDKKPKVEIKVSENNEITITLFKSKESKMGLTDELKKALDEKMKKPKPADEQDDVLSEVQADDEDENPVVNSEETPQDDMNSSDDEVNRAQKPIGKDDSNSLPGANLNGNTGGKKAQELAEQGEDQMDQPMGTEGMLQDKMNEQLGDNHEYIKMTQHAAGKQFWYRDPMTGQIIEKPNAPDGHPDFDQASVLSELIQKVETLSQQLDQLMGNEGDLDQDDISDENEMGSDLLDPENSEMEQAEEDLGQDLDGDNELGESPEHKQKILGGDKKPATPAPKSPAVAASKDDKKSAKPKPDFDKMKKSLKAKYPHLSDEKIVEVLSKATPPADLAPRNNPESEDTLSGSDGDKLGPVQGDIGSSNEAKGDSDEGNTKTKKKKVEEEANNDESNKGGEPANKKDNAFEKVRKSKFDRMWKVFKIDMPETLEKSEDQSKANDGLKKLQKCIMKQGKTESEANKIVNRAVIEKYDLFGKGKKFFQNHQEFTGGVNFNTEDESKHNFEQMQQLRKSDADARFGVKEYTESQERLVIEKSSNINEKIKEVMTPAAPSWDYKEFQGEKLEKSQPTEFQKSRQVSQDSRWNMPSWKGSERDIKEMVVAKSQSINERIQNDSLNKSKDVNFEGKYKAYDEGKTKLEKSQKTDSELMQEAIIKKNWKE